MDNTWKNNNLLRKLREADWETSEDNLTKRKFLSTFSAAEAGRYGVKDQKYPYAISLYDYFADMKGLSYDQKRKRFLNKILDELNELQENEDLENITYFYRTVFQEHRLIESVLNSGMNLIMPDKDTLKEVLMRTYQERSDFNCLDVSYITDFSGLFSGECYKDLRGAQYSPTKSYLSSLKHFGKTFNGDISKWDVSNATDMSYMFAESSFNGDISNWDVSNVENMEKMFKESRFNGDISNWDVSNVKNMNGMFLWGRFKGNIENWDVSNVTTMKNAFSTDSRNLKYVPSWYKEN